MEAIAGFSLSLDVALASIMSPRFSAAIASPTVFTSSTVIENGG